jgi:hypothetical protein
MALVLDVGIYEVDQLRFRVSISKLANKGTRCQSSA